MNAPDEPRGRRVRSLRELPQAIQPPRDLWPTIESAIAPAARTDAEPRRRAGRVPQFLALAASLAALAVGVWIGRSTLPVGPAAPGGGVTAANGAAAAVRPVAYVNDPVYRQERAQLVRSLEGRLATLSPETRKKVAASLQTIRQSMKDLEAALGRDPSNALLQELLVSTYQEEMRVLSVVKQASTVPEEI